MSHVPLVVAHRGASAAFVENTIPAFEGARALGADWVELDVRHGADGSLIVHHDERLADGRLVAAVAAPDLPAEVPLLAGALAACEGMGVNVEIKPHADLEVVRPAVEVIRAWGGPVLVSSFDPRMVDHVRDVAPDIATALLVLQVDDDVIARCAAAGHAAINPWAPVVDAQVVERGHAAGLAVNVWTVDDPDRMGELAAMGVDAIITNVPDVARALFSRQ